MDKCTAKKTLDTASHVIDSYKKSNPLLMRKKFSVKDVYFRRDCPERELFRFEMAFDTDMYVLAVAILLGFALLVYKIARCARKCEMRRLEKKYVRSLKKAKA